MRKQRTSRRMWIGPQAYFMRTKTLENLQSVLKERHGDTQIRFVEGFFNNTLTSTNRLVRGAKQKGAKVNVYDPLVNYWEELNIKIENQLPNSADYEAVVFAVPHREFAKIPMNDWINGGDILLFDANNVLTKKQVSDIRENKLNYMSIGRG